MQDVNANRGKFKAHKRPYMKLFTSDFRDGTANLSFELQGFYFRILTYLHDGETVPSDHSELARFLQCNARTVRKLLPQLVALGKLYVDGFELKNPRIERELDANSDGKNQKDEQNQEGQNTSISISNSKYIKSTTITGDAAREARNDLSNLNLDEGRLRRRSSRPPQFVTEDALDRVRDLAPGWDRQFLLQKFMDWEGSKRATNINAAFLGWVPSFVKSNKGAFQ